MHFIDNKKKLRILAGTVLLLALLIAPVTSAQAQNAQSFIGEVSLQAVAGIFNSLTYGLMFMTGKALQLMVQLVDGFLRMPITADAPVIQPAWVIVRDFANMFFIVFLIIMAFATIFDLGGSFGYAGYDIGSLLTRFLIAALLINFSLVIGQEIINATQIVNGAFLNSIPNLSATLLNGLNPQSLIGNEPAPAAPAASPPGQTALQKVRSFRDCIAEGGIAQLFGDTCGIGSLVGAANQLPIVGGWKINSDGTASKEGTDLSTAFGNLAATIMMGIVVFSLGVVFLFAVVRIPYIWFLLILSPLAWLCSVLPNTRHVSQSWWKQFWGWNLFMPIFLFFLMIGMSILSRQNEVMGALLKAWANNPGVGASQVIGKATIPVQMIFFYIFTGIVFIVGTGAAFTSSFVAGTAASGAAGWARGAVGRVTGATAIGRAAKQRADQFQKEGIPGRIGQRLYGGQAALDQQTSAWAGRFGVRGADIAAQKPFVDAVGKEYGALQDQYKTGKVDSEAIKNEAGTGNANNPKTLAYRKMAAELGMLNPDILLRTTKELQSNPLALNSFFESASKGKFAQLSPEQQLAAASASVYVNEKTGETQDYSNLETAAAAQGRRDLFTSIADNKKAVLKMTEEQYIEAVQLYGGATTSGAKDFMKKVNSQRPDLAATAKVQELIPEHLRKGEAEIYKDLVADSKPEVIAEVKLNVWEKDDFKEALRKRLAARKDSKNRDKLYSDLTDAIDGNETDKGEDKITKMGILREIYESLDQVGEEWEKEFAKTVEREQKIKSQAP